MRLLGHTGGAHPASQVPGHRKPARPAQSRKPRPCRNLGRCESCAGDERFTTTRNDDARHAGGCRGGAHAAGCRVRVRRGPRLGAARAARRRLDLPGPGRRPAAGRGPDQPARGSRRRHQLPAGSRARRAAHVRQHLSAPRSRAAGRRRVLAAAQHPVPVSRVDVRPGRRSRRRERLPAKDGPFRRRVRRNYAPAGRTAGAGLAGIRVRARRRAGRRPGRPGLRRAPRRSRPPPPALRHRRAGARGPTHLRGRRELEGDRRELP